MNHINRIDMVWKIRARLHMSFIVTVDSNPGLYNLICMYIVDTDKHDRVFIQGGNRKKVDIVHCRTTKRPSSRIVLIVGNECCPQSWYNKSQGSGSGASSPPRPPPSPSPGPRDEPPCQTLGSICQDAR